MDSLYNQAAPGQRELFNNKGQSLFAGDLLKGQIELIANLLLLDWLIKEVNPPNVSALAGKTGLLKQLLRIKLAPFNQPISTWNVERFELTNDVQDRLKGHGLAEGGALSFSTQLGGVDYIDECSKAGVPIPPDWGDSKWVSKGVLTDEFISASLEAEVFTYESTAPEGLCIALPKSNGDTIDLLGIICLGKTSSKACFWDNQRNDLQFPIKKGAVVSLTSFAGGADLDGGTGGICTSCHAGENPFIIHPKTALGSPNLKGLKLKADNWYEPLVHPSWPQNAGPSNILDLVPSEGQCTDCHTKGGSGGRFPKVSTLTFNYCRAVLENAIAKTMPPGSPGDADYVAHTNALRAACNTPPE